MVVFENSVRPRRGLNPGRVGDTSIHHVNRQFSILPGCDGYFRVIQMYIIMVKYEPAKTAGDVSNQPACLEGPGEVSIISVYRKIRLGIRKRSNIR